MGRLYRVGIQQNASPPINMLTLYPAAGTVIRVKRFYSFNTGGGQPATSQNVSWGLATWKGITAGSGGSPASINQYDPGDAAARFTARTNESPGVAGTVVFDCEVGCNSIQGIDTPLDNLSCGGVLQAFSLLLNNAPLGTLELSWYVDVEEIGGN